MNEILPIIRPYFLKHLRNFGRLMKPSVSILYFQSHMRNVDINKCFYAKNAKPITAAVTNSKCFASVNRLLRWARKPVNHTSWVALVTPTDRPKSVRNRCLIELFCGVVCVVTCPFDISVGVGAFVIGLGQISSFLSLAREFPFAAS